MKKTALALMLGGVLLAGTATAHEAGSIVVRAGAITVDANSGLKSTNRRRCGFKSKK